jgi:hypothetical protein
MRGALDLRQYCETACIKLWGEPNKRTKKELRWNGGDAYSARTYTISKHLWYDHGAKRGGSTLELVDYHKGRPKRDLRGRVFFDVWREANEMGIVPEPAPEPTTNGGGTPITATYPYHDEQGALLFEVVRFDTTDPDERFRQRRPDGRGGWIWNIEGTRRVLYRLPELIEGIACGYLVLVCEGERDAEAARRLGYVATTHPGGVGKWRDEYDEFFRDASVVVVSDNDPQLKDPKTGEPQFHPDGRPVLKGQDHAAQVAQRLARVAKRVRKIMFEVKDLRKWLDEGHTREQLDALIEQAPAWKPQPEPPRKERKSWRQFTFTSRELKTMTFDPITFIVPGLIPAEGVTLICAKPKIGKSWLLLDMCLSATADRYVLGNLKSVQGNVLYLALEDGPRRLQSRMTKLLPMFSVEWPENLTHATEWRRVDQGGLDDIRDWVDSTRAAGRKVAFIAIDVLKMI